MKKKKNIHLQSQSPPSETEQITLPREQYYNQFLNLVEYTMF